MLHNSGFPASERGQVYLSIFFSFLILSSRNYILVNTLRVLSAFLTGIPNDCLPPMYYNIKYLTLKNPKGQHIHINILLDFVVSDLLMIIQYVA